MRELHPTTSTMTPRPRTWLARHLALVAASLATIAVLAAACGGSDTPDAPATQDPPPAPSTPAPETAANAEAPVAQQAEPTPTGTDIPAAQLVLRLRDLGGVSLVTGQGEEPDAGGRSAYGRAFKPAIGDILPIGGSRFLTVASRVIVATDEAGAEETYAAAVASGEAAGDTAPFVADVEATQGFTPGNVAADTAAPAIGDQAALAEIRFDAPTDRQVRATLVFRVGDTVATLTVESADATYDRADLLALAQIVENRLRERLSLPPLG